MSLRHGLLGLLVDDPGSGWDLLKRFERSLAFVWPATQSQLYTELNRMAGDGLVEATEVGPRNRKEYAITAAGRAELERWLTETEPDRVHRSDSLLRVFFLWTVDPDQARAYLEHEAEVHRRHHELMLELARSISWDESVFDRFGRLALENGLRISDTNERWARWAAEQVPD
ncbi:MAG: PadR family transcriptional regulator [Acidimicrobiales bacterium]